MLSRRYADLLIPELERDKLEVGAYIPDVLRESPEHVERAERTESTPAPYGTFSQESSQEDSPDLVQI